MTGAPPSREADPVDDARQAELGDALARAFVELRSIVGDLLELAGVELDRLRVGVRTGILRLLVLLWLALTALAATVFAAWVLVDGVAGGIAEILGGRLWAGRAIGGAAILLAVCLFALIARAGIRRSHLERLTKKYERGTRR